MEGHRWLCPHCMSHPPPPTPTPPQQQRSSCASPPFPLLGRGCGHQNRMHHPSSTHTGSCEGVPTRESLLINWISPVCSMRVRQAPPGLVQPLCPICESLLALALIFVSSKTFTVCPMCPALELEPEVCLHWFHPGH